SQIHLYFRLEKIQQNNLPDFTIAFFPGNAWLRINPYSPLAKRFDLSRSGLIALADVPESIFAKIDPHIVAIGTLNGLRRVTLPVQAQQTLGILKLAIGLLASKNPCRGYIYGNDVTIAYFAEIFRKSFGSSEIEILREYERAERMERYLSLGSALSSACLRYFNSIPLLEQTLATRLAGAEALIAAFGSIKVRRTGSNYRPPTVLLKHPPPFAKSLLASVGILSVSSKLDLKIPFSEFAKFATLDLPESFRKLTAYRQVPRLREPIPLLTILAVLSHYKKVKQTFLDHLGCLFYGRQVITSYHLRKYSEAGIVTLQKGGTVACGPLFDEILISEGRDVILAYASFISEIRRLKIADIWVSNEFDDKISESSLEELHNRIKEQEKMILVLQNELFAAKHEIEILKIERSLS
ncbi:MAG: hypothetical protein ACFFB3_05660, partial [Candidatus Hodarchaeota archaeon]